MPNTLNDVKMVHYLLLLIGFLLFVSSFLMYSYYIHLLFMYSYYIHHLLVIDVRYKYLGAPGIPIVFLLVMFVLALIKVTIIETSTFVLLPIHMDYYFR